MADLVESAYSTTNKKTDEQLLLAGLTSFSLRKDIQDVLETSGLRGEHFYNPVWGDVWDAARKLAAENRIMTPELLAQNVEGEAQKRAIAALTGEPVRLVEVTKAVEIVKAAHQRRQLIDTTKRILEQTADAESYDDALAFTHEQLSKLDEAESADHATSASDGLDELWHAIDSDTDDKTPPVSTGILALDEQLNGGMRRGQVMIVGGRPNDGKSILSIQMAADSAVRGLGVAVFSAEMSQIEVMKRMVACTGQVEYKQLIREQLDEKNRAKAMGATELLRGSNLKIFDPPAISMAYVRQQCRLMKRQSGLDVVVIDYIQIIEPEDKKVSREQQVGGMSWAAKQLARELECVVIVAAQLNRGSQGGPREDKGPQRPDLKELRESDRLSQDPDVVVLIHHPKKMGRQDEIELLVAKSRNGSRGVVTRINKFDEARIL